MSSIKWKSFNPSSNEWSYQIFKDIIRYIISFDSIEYITSDDRCLILNENKFPMKDEGHNDWLTPWSAILQFPWLALFCSHSRSLDKNVVTHRLNAMKENILGIFSSKIKEKITFKWKSILSCNIQMKWTFMIKQLS